MPLDQELIDRLIFMDGCSRVIRSKADLKKRLIEISHEDLPRRHHPLWQVRCLNLDYGDQVALVLRCHQSLCDGMGLMSLLVSQLADQAPPSTTTFIRTCNGTMTATNCKLFSPAFLNSFAFRTNVFLQFACHCESEFHQRYHFQRSFREYF